MTQVEALLELVDLGLDRRRVTGVALEHLDRDRAAIGRAQQAEFDLQLAGLVVAAVAVLRQRAGAAFEPGRGQVVHHQHAVLEMALGERLLDAPLVRQQPIERRVEFLLADGIEAEHRPERGRGGCGIELAGRGQLRTRLDHASNDEGQHQVGQPSRCLGGEQPVEPNPPRRSQHRRDMAVRQRAQHRQSTLTRLRHLVAQHPAQRLDLRCRPVREVGKGARLDLVADAIAFAQEDGGWRISVRDACNVHE